MAALELLFFLSYLRPLLEPLRLPLDELELLVELVPLLRDELLELLVLALELLLVRLLEPLTLLELLPLGREVLLLGRLTLPLVAGRVLEPLTLLELFGREVPLLLGRLTELLVELLLLGRLTEPLLLPAVPLGRLLVLGRALLELPLLTAGVLPLPLPELMLPAFSLGLTVALGAMLLLGLGISLLLHSGWVAG